MHKIVHPVKKPSDSESIYGSNLIIRNKIVTVRDLYSNNMLEYYYKMDSGKWAHVSKVADVASKAAPKSMTKQLPSRFHVCAADSMRNIGRQGMFVNNVIEFGTLYHLLIPELKLNHKLSKTTLNLQIIAEAKTKGK